MKAFFYGNDDRTGVPIHGESLIVFHDDESAADAIAERHYGESLQQNKLQGIAAIKIGSAEVTVGGMVSASSFYGVSLDVVSS
jgi:hypothetical protein